MGKPTKVSQPSDKSGDPVETQSKPQTKPAGKAGATKAVAGGAAAVKEKKPRATKSLAGSTAKAVPQGQSKPAKVQGGPGTEEIALRAYYLAEKRHRDGIPGDSESDWLEAERQVRAEMGLGKKPRKPTKKAG